MTEEQNPPQQNPSIPRMMFNQNTESILNKHLDNSDVLLKVEMMLKGFEYDNEEDEWKQSEVIIGTNKEGHIIKQKIGALMEISEINSTMTYLRSFLNPNTYLSYIKDDDLINEIMWDLNIKLGKMFYRLRGKLSPTERDAIWSTIEYPILLALKRADSKVTLNAVSQMQQSIEHRTISQTQQPEKFKVLG